MNESYSNMILKPRRDGENAIPPSFKWSIMQKTELNMITKQRTQLV